MQQNSVVQTARDEIARIRKSADDPKKQRIPIQQLREKIKVDGGEDIDAIIDEQNPKSKLQMQKLIR